MPERPYGEMGESDRCSPRQVHRGGRAGSQDQRRAVRPLAGWDDLPPVEECKPTDHLTQLSQYSPAIPGEGCPTALTANLHVRQVGLSDPDHVADECGNAYGPRYCDRSTTPSANSRSRQPDTTPRQPTTDENRGDKQPDIPNGEGLRLTRPPLHSRGGGRHRRRNSLSCRSTPPGSCRRCGDRSWRASC